MPYVEEICVAGKTIEVSKHYTYSHNQKGGKREKKEKPTREAQKKVNRRKAEKFLRRLMNNNFMDGDFLLTFDYRFEERPLGKKEMHEIIKAFLRKVRNDVRKGGGDIKYIHCMEVGPRGARHHHAMINKVDIEILRKHWTHGGIHIDPLYSDGQYKKIASYFMKYEDKTQETEGQLVGRRYYPSRNLEKPISKKKIIPAGYFKKKIKEVDGYYLEENTVRSGICEFNGYEYFSYTLIRMEKKAGGGRSG